MRVSLGLPRCPRTELPRLLCDCCDSFTMTQAEIDYLNGRLGAPDMLAVYPVRARGTYEHQVVPLGEYQSRPWTEPADVKVADSTNPCRVPYCTRPAGDAFVCNPCIDELEVCLGDIPGLVTDLLILEAKESRFAEFGVGGDPSPLPYVPVAGEQHRRLTNAVTTAVWALAKNRGIRLQPMGAQAASVWLLNHIRAVALDPGGPDAVADITRETARARRLIDRPPDSRYIGLCENCRTPMHARHDHPEHRCTTCGATYVVETREAEQTERVRSSLLTLSEIAKASERYLGCKLSIKQLEGLVRRGRLVQKGSKPCDCANRAHETHALYRAGDLLPLIEERRHV